MTSSTASGLNHLPSGRFAANGGVARGAGDRAQPRPLDGAAGARRGNRDDQDAQAALLRFRRTAHPLCPALDPAPPEALALGRAAGSRARAATGATAPGLTPAHSAGPAPRLAPALPEHASRTRSVPRPQRPRADALLAPAPPGERRHSRQTLRQPGIPPRHASIGGSGLSREEPWFVVKSHSITATGLSDRRAVPRSWRPVAS